jgi:hypothetical protein
LAEREVPHNSDKIVNIMEFYSIETFKAMHDKIVELSKRVE